MIFRYMTVNDKEDCYWSGADVYEVDTFNETVRRIGDSEKIHIAPHEAFLAYLRGSGEDESAGLIDMEFDDAEVSYLLHEYEKAVGYPYNMDESYFRRALNFIFTENTKGFNDFIQNLLQCDKIMNTFYEEEKEYQEYLANRNNVAG